MKSVKSSNVALLIALAIIWGSSYILMKKGLASFSAIQVSMMRIIFAFLALLPFLPKAIKNCKKQDIIFALLVAVLGSGIPSYLYPLAITKVDSGVTGIINTLTPVFTMFFGWIFFRINAGWKKVVGLILALFGAGMLIFLNPNNSSSTLQLNYFALAAVLATVCYGFSSNILKSKLNHVNPVQLTSLTFALIGPVALIILLSTNFIEVVRTDTNAFQSIIYIGFLGVFGTAFALVLFNNLIKKTDALYASSVTFLIPIVAIFWGLIDGETFTLYHIFGLIFIFLGLMLMNWKAKKGLTLR